MISITEGNKYITTQRKPPGKGIDAKAIEVLRALLPITNPRMMYTVRELSDLSGYDTSDIFNCLHRVPSTMIGMATINRAHYWALPGAAQVEALAKLVPRKSHHRVRHGRYLKDVGRVDPHRVREIRQQINPATGRPYSLRDVADRCGISHETARKICMGLPGSTGKIRRPAPAEHMLVEKMRYAWAHPAEYISPNNGRLLTVKIADELGLRRGELTRWLHFYGYETNGSLIGVYLACVAGIKTNREQLAYLEDAKEDMAVFMSEVGIKSRSSVLYYIKLLRRKVDGRVREEVGKEGADGRLCTGT